VPLSVEIVAGGRFSLSSLDAVSSLITIGRLLQGGIVEGWCLMLGTPRRLLGCHADLWRRVFISLTGSRIQMRGCWEFGSVAVANEW